MRKRGQITLFIITALLVFAAFALIYFIQYLQTERQDLLFSIGLTSEVNALRENVDACLERTTRQGVKDYFGVKESSQAWIESYIEAELEDCIDYEKFEGLGLDIESGSVDVRVLVTDRAVLVDLNYPITITKGDATTKLDKFNYYMEREKRGIFSFGADQRTTQTITIVTEDGDAELIIPAGTRITDANGNPITQVSLKILDRNFDGLNNNVLIGMVAYEGFPEGARFDPPVTIKLSYDLNEIPPGMKEEDIKIGWWDKEKGIWWGLPSSSVDTINKIVSAQISHFTPVGKVGCTAMEEITQEPKPFEKEYAHPDPPLYEQTCGKSYRGEGDCLDVKEWDNKGEITGWHEEQGKEEPKLKSGPNEPVQTMLAYFSCSEEPIDWDKDDLIDDASNCECKGAYCDEVSGSCPEACLAKANSEITIDPKFVSGDGIHDIKECSCRPDTGDNVVKCGPLSLATPATYGYENINSERAADGWAVITFNIAPDGKGCVMERPTEITGTRAGAGFIPEADVDVMVICSPGDTCGGKEFSKDQDYTYITNNVPFNAQEGWSVSALVSGQPVLPVIGEDQGLKEGVNKAYIKIENTDGDGCAWAEAKISINGVGITFETDFGDVECTVQDAISTLCGKGSDYNDNYPNCEQDSQGNPIGFLSSDRGPILNQIINSARGVDPDNWRKLSLSQLQDYDDIAEKMENLELTCIQGPWQPPSLTCDAQQGTMMESVKACKEAGGKTVPQTGSYEGVCCVGGEGKVEEEECAGEECGADKKCCTRAPTCCKKEGDPSFLCYESAEGCVELSDKSWMGDCPIGELKEENMHCVCNDELIWVLAHSGKYCCEDGLKEEECEEEPQQPSRVDCPNGGHLGLTAWKEDNEVDWIITYSCLSDVNLKLSAPGYSATQNYGRNMNDPRCGGKQILPEYEGNLKRFPVPECEGTFEVALYDAGGQCEHKTVTVSLQCK